MRLSITLALLAFVAICHPSAAQQFGTPEDLVETLYGGYFGKLRLDDFSPYLSDELTKAMAGGKVGISQFEALGFDPIVGSADWEPRDFHITSLHQNTDTAQVMVSFTTRGLPVTVTLDLVLEPINGWQISHLAGKSGARSWCTNDIVKAATSRP